MNTEKAIKEISYTSELFYVLGALLGDGCVYKWRTYYYTILVGDEKFAKKYAERLARCTGTKIKAYIDRNHNVWFVRTNNSALFSLLVESRKNISSIENILKGNSAESSLMFLEGFFDAEGCVKIIKEPVRKTPKICLDFTNTNYLLLEIMRLLLKIHLGIEARYSSQEAYLNKDGFYRQKVYHLRIYKKEYVRRFFEHINTTKLKEEKIPLVKKWLTTNVSAPSDSVLPLSANPLRSTNL